MDEKDAKKEKIIYAQKYYDQINKSNLQKIQFAFTTLVKNFSF